VFPPVLTAFRSFIMASFFPFVLSSMSFLFKYCKKKGLLFRINIIFHIEPLLIYVCYIQLRGCEFHYYCCLDCKYSVILQSIFIVIIIIIIVVVTLNDLFPTWSTTLR
jgi:hypothetical protein